MKSSPRLSNEASQTTKGPRNQKSASMLLLATALDTTWRFFVPTLAGTFIGIGLDSTFHTAPVFMIIMVVLGCIATGVLIARQLRDVRNQQ
jgi:F0F1-type ATP synthase assembly protein I